MVDNEYAPDGGNHPDAAPIEPAEVSPPALSLDDYRRLLDRLDALEREKAARERADAAAAGEVFVHPDTHVLVLANGDTVTTCCPSITHVALDDEKGTVVPVVSRHELNPAV
jgi:hypothetical protein